MLDVTPATLYAYVSRGLLHSIAAPKGRARLYSIADLTRLQRRRDARRGHTAVAAAALDWGAPVLDSAITRIDASGPHYRGQSAVELARQQRQFEQVAELLWQGEAEWAPDPLAAKVLASLRKLEVDPPSRLGRLTAYVAARGLADPDRRAKAPQLERDRAARLLYGMSGALLQLSAAAGTAAARTARSEAKRDVKAPVPGLTNPGQRQVMPRKAAPTGPRDNEQPRLASLVAQALGVQLTPRIVAAINQMLVLCADHELNVSTFAVRVTASGGADLYACITAGLCALSGGAHGGVCDRVELLAEACRREAQAERPMRSVRPGVARVVQARLAAGESIPGFGQPLYPDGDPRGLLLLELARKHAERAPRVQTILGIVDAMESVGRHDPTLDLGLCALSGALELPLGAASAIFALGRVAGWVAHALEQRERPVLLRPRARYVGP
jgi:citrate synthase